MRAIRLILIGSLTCAAAIAQQPRIDSVAPAAGPIAGGTLVTLRGPGLGGASIAIDRVAVTPLLQSETEVRLQMPAHDNGFAVITARSGNDITYADYLYTPPRLAEIAPGFITTVAGIGPFTRDYGPATRADLSPWGLALDRDGRVYIASALRATVHRVDRDGTIERVAGTGITGTGGDAGPAIDAQLHFPQDIATDSRGNVYVGGNGCVLRRIDPSGTISAFAGNGTCAFGGDAGPAASARIFRATFLAGNDDDLFFIDYDPTTNGVRIRRIHLSDGIISTFAGNGVRGFSGDGGPAIQASFDFGSRTSDAGELALDSKGNLYIADPGNRRVRRVDRSSGNIATFFVGPTSPAAPDALGEPNVVATDSSDNVYVGGAGRIVKLSPAGALITAWGNGRNEMPVDGAAAATSGLGGVIGLVIAANGDIIYTDGSIRRVRKIVIATGLLETVAGIGPAVIGENGPALASAVATGGEGTGLTFTRTGELLVADTGSFRLRKLQTDGTLVTIGGTGAQVGLSGDGNRATSISMYPSGVSVDARGEYDVAAVSDLFHIDANGNAFHLSKRNFANCGFDGDGRNVSDALFCQPWDVAHDRAGNLFVADTNNNRIRRVDASTGIVSTVAGSGPVNGYERYGFGSSSGDGGQAVDAHINTPYGIAFDDAANLYIAEQRHIRRVDTTGTITNFADVMNVSKLAFFRGYLYAASTDVFRLDASGNRAPLAGGGIGTLIGDGGPALLARVATTAQAQGIAVDAEGNVFFADVGNRRIRAIRYGAVLAPQNATIEASANGSQLRAVVRDAAGRPAPSVRVDFTAPPSGATCSLSMPFAITDADGVASATCTPNCVEGTYTVTAQPLTAASKAAVSLTNRNVLCRRRSVRH